MIPRFSVSQVRSAASCPRLFYFDQLVSRQQSLKYPRVTRIWKRSDDRATACGSLFHASVEGFNRRAGRSQAVTRLLEKANTREGLAEKILHEVYTHDVDYEKLVTKPADNQEAFIETLRGYTREVADLLWYARDRDVTPQQVVAELFGDDRKWVDVTFHVGCNAAPIQIRGSLDYVFYDWRSNSNRILDYKLTPADSPNNDLIQVALYSLMHNIQHQTKANVGVLYLYPKRFMNELAWADVWERRAVVFDLLASMLEWSDFKSKKGRSTGIKPPGDPTLCDVCPYRKICVKELGPKEEGDRVCSWEELPPEGVQATVERHEIVERPPFEPIEEAPADEELINGPVPPPPSVGRSAEPMLMFGATLHDSTPVQLPPAVLNTHVAVVGAAGSGKTWAAKVMAEEAIRLGVPVIAIDPQGDLVQFLLRQNESAVRDQWKACYRDFAAAVEPRIYTPGSSHATRLSLSPIRLSKRDDFKAIEDEARRAELEAELLSTVAENLVRLGKIGGEEGSQRTFLYHLLKALSATGKGTLSLEDVVEGIRLPDRHGLVDVDNLMIKKGEREKLARALGDYVHGPSSALFQGGETLDLDRMITPSTKGKTPLNVIYLNALVGDASKHFFVAALAAEIYRWMVSSLDASSGKPNLLFYIDEARDYIPAGVKNPPAKDPLIRLFTQGRKYGVGCLLCTQSPRSVDYNVFGNCSTKVIGRLESKQDTERVGEWFSTSGAIPEWISRRKGAAKGTFVMRWPEMPEKIEGKEIKTRELYSQHESAWSPERVEREMQRFRMATGG
jgi:hypothetical protein